MKIDSGLSTFQTQHKAQVNTETTNSSQLNKHSVSINQKTKSISIEHFLNNLKALGSRLSQRISASVTSLKNRVITQFKPEKPTVLLDPKVTSAKQNMGRFDNTECKEHTAIMPGRLHANKIALNTADGQKVADTFAIAAQFPIKPEKPTVLLDPKVTSAKQKMGRFDNTECKEHTAIMPGRLHANKIALNTADGQKVADTFAIAAQFPKPHQLEDHLLTLFKMKGGVVTVLASEQEMANSIKGKNPNKLKELITEDHGTGLTANYSEHYFYGVKREEYIGAAMINYFSGFDTQEFGRFTVTSKKIESSNLTSSNAEEGKEKGITLNKYELTLKDRETGAMSNVTVMHFDNWPDFGAPDVGAVSQMVDLIENQNAQSEHPPMVHCLAGVGRTALVVGGLGLKQSLDQNLGMDHKEIIQSMRMDRSNQMLETQKQINVLEQYQNQLGIQSKTTGPDIAPSDDKSAEGH